MKHKRFEENILVDEAYTNYGQVDKNADQKKSQGIAKHFAETLEFEEKKKWYHQMPAEPATITKTLSESQIQELRKEANSALHGDTLAYETRTNKSGSSDHQWAKTLMKKGTAGDRVAAATILIQDNPVYNLAALRNLVSNVKPAKKKDGAVTIDALSELLMAELLIPDTKLRTFEQHPLGHVDEMTSGNKQARRNILTLWYFEDQLKELYLTYVEALNKFAHDSVETNKEKAVSAMTYLLMHHPEKERMLLNNVINKMGDPSQTVASKVVYHLCQLLYNHPNMKAVVLAEVEKMLFRSRISPRAQYYGICFLNQFVLGKDDSKIAENLIRIYFSFFKASIKQGDINTRVMSAILTGVKRAYPFADKDRLTESQTHVDAIHKLVHLANVNTSVNALALLFQIRDASAGTSDRYYSSLYRKLTKTEIFLKNNHTGLLFSLIFKSLKQDKDVQRVTSFIKRLLQLCCYLNPALACGMLFLISQVLKNSDMKDAIRLVWTKRDVKDEEIQLNDTKEVTDDGETEKKEDVEEKQEQKKVDLLHGDKNDLLIDDGEEESYADLKMDDDGNIKAMRRQSAHGNPGWFHAKVTVEDTKVDLDKELETKIQLKKSINKDRAVTEYNPFARNPTYAGAQFTAYVELLPLARHFHPTVKLFAENLITEKIISYSGDPLKDFSGISFLERFVFKNPKQRVKNNEQEAWEVKTVKGSHPKFALRKNYSAKGIKSLRVNSTSYLNENAQKIPVDERFLYDYLQQRRTADASDDDDSDSDSVNSEDFEQYLDTVTGAKADANSDEELDFLAEMEASKHLRPRTKNDEQDSEDDELGDDDGDDVEGGSDGELNISGDEEEPALSGDDDELLLEDSDDDDQIDVPGKKSGKNKKFKLKGKDDLGSLFASAEEFSTLLEETASNKKQGSSQAVSNTDNSSTKQLAWEENRDRWIKGFNRKILGNKPNKKGKNKFNNAGNTNKKFHTAGNTNKMADKGGKRKGANVQSSGGKRKKFK